MGRREGLEEGKVRRGVGKRESEPVVAVRRRRRVHSRRFVNACWVVAVDERETVGFFLLWKR